MGEPFIGTLISVFDFLNTAKQEISITLHDGTIGSVAELKENRTYYIPAYQREIRWEEKHICELVRDINSGKNFLGNMILSQNGAKYEVIDGQQRITCLRMLVEYIQYVHTNPDALETINLCEVVVNSFAKYPILRDAHYDISSLAPEGKKEVEDSDYYHQSTRYCNLWATLSNLPELGDNIRRRELLRKLKTCMLNLIIFNNARNDQKIPIEYFISVNQKGVKLDKEDILKGFLFQYNSALAKSHWEQIKKNCCAMNYQSEKNQKRMLLTDLFEQYFYCQLYNSDIGTGLEFNADFLLKKDFIPANGSYTFYKGSHLIEVLTDLERGPGESLSNDIKQIAVISNDLRAFICDSYPAEVFKRLINPSLQKSEHKISEEGIQCYANLIQHILLSPDKIPKILVIKYLLDVLHNPEIINCSDKDQFPLIKRKYETVFPIFVLSTLFSMFSGSKEKASLYPKVSGKDWIAKVYSAIHSYSGTEKSIKDLTSFTYRIFVQLRDCEDDTRRDQYRCKSLAGVYNYLIANKTKESLTPEFHFCTPDKMFTFFNDTRSEYTLEHFLLNEGKKYCLSPKHKESKTYPACLNKYIGAIYNFIFVHKSINGGVLDNYVLPAKIEILTHKGKAYDELSNPQKELIERYPITCQYSNAVLSILGKTGPDGKHIFFPLFWEAYEIDSENGQLDRITEYYQTAYEAEYFAFTTKINELFISKIQSEGKKYAALIESVVQVSP